MEKDCSNSNIEEEEEEEEGRRRMETREERGDCLGGEAEEEDVESLSIPRGGPIYVPNLVGPLSSVPHFKASLLHQLQVAIFEVFFLSFQSLYQYSFVILLKE